ncbi:hypothetical protein [Fusobacterium hominis]|uniref:hypothetical protein n=1 Tax=Fusobacterium hominis TaxID=2764326 RepID=UPI0022E6AE7E|nr:hypothetical protein [Fusobacterium hominis]
MKLFPKSIKNNGYLSLNIIILTIILISNYLLGYKLINNKIKRLKAKYLSEHIENMHLNLITFAYDELYRIDQKINNGIYKNGAEYIGKIKNHKIWFTNNFKNLTDEGFHISKMSLNKSYFFHNTENNTNFAYLIKREIYSHNRMDKIFNIELKKEFISSYNNRKVFIKAIVLLEYRAFNKDILSPDREELKEFVVYFEHI